MQPPNLFVSAIWLGAVLSWPDPPGVFNGALGGGQQALMSAHAAHAWNWILSSKTGVGRPGQGSASSERALPCSSRKPHGCIALHDKEKTARRLVMVDSPISESGHRVQKIMKRNPTQLQKRTLPLNQLTPKQFQRVYVLALQLMMTLRALDPRWSWCVVVCHSVGDPFITSVLHPFRPKLTIEQVDWITGGGFKTHAEETESLARCADICRDNDEDGGDYALKIEYTRLGLDLETLLEKLEKARGADAAPEEESSDESSGKNAFDVRARRGNPAAALPAFGAAAAGGGLAARAGWLWSKMGGLSRAVPSAFSRVAPLMKAGFSK